MARRAARLVLVMAITTAMLAIPVTTAGAATSSTYRDEFASGFTGNDGSLAWTTDWLEIGESDGPAGGSIEVLAELHCLTGPCMVLGRFGPADVSVEREANLSGMASATLRFDYKRHMHIGGAGQVILEISRSGSGNWTQLDIWNLGVTDPTNQTTAYNITPYLSSDTRVRFRLTNSSDQSHFNVDNVEIAEGTWATVESGTIANLDGVYTADSLRAYAVGNGGTILTTDAGGATWESRVSGVASDLNAAFFPNGSDGFAAGDAGTLLRTTNGGNTWTPKGPGSTERLNDLDFIDAWAGYVVGDDGTIFKTENSANSWTPQTSGTGSHLNALDFIDASIGYAVGQDGVILKTTDGGANWTPQISGTGNHLESVFFLDANKGFAVGDFGTLLETNNGGANWVESNLGVELNAVFFTDANKGYIVGNTGAVFSTNNGGAAWTPEPVPTIVNLNDVHFSPAGNGFIVGDNGTILTWLNTPPALDEPDDHVIAADSPFSLTVTATDADFDPLTLSAAGLPTWASFTDHGDNTATISGTPLPSDAGPSSITVTADDGFGNSDSDEFEVLVVERGTVYLVGSDGEDLLTNVDATDIDPTTNEGDIGPTGTANLGSLSFQPVTGTLFAVDGGQLGTIDLTTGAFTALPSLIGTASGAKGLVAITDVTGIAFEQSTGWLYGTADRGTGQKSLLLRIDPTTGAAVPGTFGGDDYIELAEQATRKQISDIAFDPFSGLLHGVQHDGATYSLVTIDTATGATTELGPTKANTAGIDFDSSGNLWGSDTTPGNGLLAKLSVVDGSVISFFPIDNASGYAALAILDNNAPTFDQDLSDRSHAEGTTITPLPSPASDPDIGDNLLYSATGLPPGLAINPANGTISGTISTTGVGSYATEITVIDDGTPSLSDTDTFSWAVTNVNEAPTFDQDLLDRSDAEGSLISITSGASDPDLDTLTYSATGLPEGVSINPATGQIMGAPSPNASGAHAVTIAVTDDATPNLQDTDGFTWTVTDGAVVYLVANAGGAAGGDDLLTVADLTDPNPATNEVNIGPGTGTTNIESIALQPGTNVLFGIENDQLGTIDPSSGTFTPLPQIVGTGDGSVGPIVFNNIESLTFDPFTGVLYASHRRALGEADLVFRLDPTTGAHVPGVFGGDDYVAVQIQWPYHHIPDFAFDPTTGQLFAIHWDFGGLWSLATLDPATGATVTIGALPLDVHGLASDGAGRLWATTADTAGSYVIYEIDKSDGSVVSTVPVDNGANYEAIAISFPLVANAAPAFDQDLPDRSDSEGAAIALSAGANDPDAGDVVTYDATGLPPGLSIDPGSGLISGTLTFAAAGTHNVEVTATDNGIPNLSTAPDTFTWTVTNTNRPPVVDAIADQTVAENDPFSLAVSASDPDGTTPTLTASGLPAWATFTDNTDGTATITGTPSYSDAGLSSVTVTANDGTLTGTGSFDLTVTNTNRPPVVAPIADQTVAENDPFSLAVSASDADGTTPSLTASGLPAWATFTDNTDGTATITGTPGFNDAATSSVTVTASDGTLTDDESFDLTVTNTNRPPVVADPGSQATTEGSPFSMTLTASDPDGATPTFDAGGTLPAWGALTDNGDGTASISGTPGYTDSGITSVTMTVSDGLLTDAVTFDIVVFNTDRPPVVDPIADQSVAENDPFSLTVTGSDPDGLTPSLSDSATLPAWATLTDNGDGSATITGTPGFSDAGASLVTITASDGALTGTETFRLTVTNTNRAPVVGPIADGTTPEGDLYILNVGAIDPDGAIPSLTAAGLPAWATFADNGDGTATITGTPGFDDAAVSTVTISASDGSLTGTATFQLTVTNTNRPPVVDLVANQSVAENDPFSLIVTASDPDATMPAITAAGLPTWATLTDHGNGTATIAGTPGFSDAGTTAVAITANDGFLTGSIVFDLTVSNTNRPPAVDPIADQTVAENDSFSLVVAASDPDGTTPFLSAAGLPAWATLSDNGDGTATITGTPGFDDAGPTTITVTASDGVLDDDTSFELTVAETNRAPSVDPVANQTIAENSPFSLVVTASDPDATIPAITAAGLPTWATLTDHGNGTATITGTPGFSDAGSTAVTVKAHDGTLTATRAFDLTVTNTNRAPSLTNPGPQSLPENHPFNIVVTASDPDGDPVTVTATGVPSWAAFTTGAGGAAITGTPTAADAGISTVKVSAADGTTTTSVSFTIEVTVPNHAPTVTITGDPATAEAVPLGPIVISGSDPDGTAVTITAAGLPAWASLRPDGTVTGTPGYDDAGTSTATITVTDPGGLSTSVSLEIEVANTNRPATAAWSGDTSTAEGAPLGPILMAAADPDGDPITIVLAQAPPWIEISLDTDGSTAVITGTPDYDAAGKHTIEIYIYDGTDTTLVTFEVEVVATNRLAVGADEAVTTNADTAIALSVLQNYVDPDGDRLTVAAVSVPGNGTAALRADGTIVYVPASGFEGIDTFTYTVEDSQGGQFTATVSVNVLAAYLAIYTDKAAAGLLIQGMGADLAPPDLSAEKSRPALSPTDGLQVAFGAAAESLKSQILPALLLGILIAWLLILGVGRRDEEEAAGG